MTAGDWEVWGTLTYKIRKGAWIALAKKLEWCGWIKIQKTWGSRWYGKNQVLLTQGTLDVLFVVGHLNIMKQNKLPAGLDGVYWIRIYSRYIHNIYISRNQKGLCWRNIIQHSNFNYYSSCDRNLVRVWCKTKHQSRTEYSLYIGIEMQNHLDKIM